MTMMKYVYAGIREKKKQRSRMGGQHARHCKTIYIEIPKLEARGQEPRANSYINISSCWTDGELRPRRRLKNASTPTVRPCIKPEIWRTGETTVRWTLSRVSSSLSIVLVTNSSARIT